VSVRVESKVKLIKVLRDAPVTVPALAALALFVTWAASQGGYPVTHWAPGGLIVLTLLAIALWSVPLRLRDVPVAVRIAVGCLALYTVWSFLSILWARVPGDAWEGADRTLLYLLVFMLFALWPQRGTSAAFLLVSWTLAMIGLTAFVMLHVNGASSLSALFSEGRLKYPADYENASAATWAMVVWPALLLAACERIPWGLRGALAGGAVLLADLALFSQSRGSFYATPVMLIIVFALMPGRLRTFVVLVPIVIGIGVTAPGVLRVGERLVHGDNAKAALHHATMAAFLAALLVGLVVALGAAIEGRRSFSATAAARVHRGVAALAIATLLAVLAGGWVVAGNPVARVRHGWDTFKSPRGYAANGSGNRLTSGLGSQRYDFYRVALNEFAAHPLTGIGADNFQQEYLMHGRSEATPHYPHSVELRTLAQTGVIGALLALLGLGAALVAAVRAIRSSVTRGSDPLARAVAIAALGGFVYWAVHGSVDWFWEVAGLGAPAFALLGLACALAPRVPTARAPLTGERVSGWRQAAAFRRLSIGVGALVAVTAALSLAAPWLSQLQVQNAVRSWPTAPRRAYSDLDDAARLDPLSDEPYLLAGSIALRFGDLARADQDFALALGRTPRDVYATLERGAIASARGDRREALRLLERAVRLSPHDKLLREALGLLRKGRRLNIEELNRSILFKARQLA